MGRKKIWLGKFRVLNIKVYDETLQRYKQIMAAKKKTIQQDIDEHIKKTISG